MDERFFRERKVIGKGRQATVYLWEGFAYKVYPESYPLQSIAFEMRIQRQISQTALPVVKYYETDRPRIIRMDHIAGMTLSEKILSGRCASGMEDLLCLQRQIHRIDDVDLPYIDKDLEKEILGMDCAEKQKAKAMESLSWLGQADSLCHLDFHPSNILWRKDGYTVIDWVNARRGRPVYDFARTYVILFEVSCELAKRYMRLLEESGEDRAALDKAIYVMALWRSKEVSSHKALELLAQHEQVTRGI